MVDLRLFGEDIALERRIAGHISAVQTERIARVPGEAQCRPRHALVNRSDVEGHAEVAFAAASQVSPAKQEHRSGFAEGHLPISGKRAARIAGVVGPAERERLSAGNRSLAAKLISVIKQSSGTEVESAAKREDVIDSLHGVESELARVAHTVLIEAAAVIESREPHAHVRAASDGHGKIGAESEQGSLESDARPMIEAGTFRSLCHRSRRGGVGIGRWQARVIRRKRA